MCSGLEQAQNCFKWCIDDEEPQRACLPVKQQRMCPQNFYDRFNTRVLPYGLVFTAVVLPAGSLVDKAQSGKTQAKVSALVAFLLQMPAQVYEMTNYWEHQNSRLDFYSTWF